jgi:hypothetical protein
MELEIYNHEKHWNEFLNEKVAVNCPTEDLAKEFLAWCYSGDLKRRFGKGETPTFDYWILKGETTYGIESNALLCDDINEWIDLENNHQKSYPILQFQGFTK